MASLVLMLAAQEVEPGAGVDAVDAVVSGVGGLIGLAITVLMIAALWKVFVKAGQPGWAAIVPIYNLIVLIQIVGKPLWWIVLFLIPCANIVALVLISIALAERFGKSAAFGVGLALLGPIFFPMLAFGDAKYQRP